LQAKLNSAARAGGPQVILASYSPGPGAAPLPAPDPQSFVQDVSDGSNVAPSTFVQNCCAMQVQNLQTSFTSVVQQVPTFNSQFKVLNLLSVAINMISDLTNRAKQMSQAFVALKQAPNAQAALAALANLSTQVDGTSQAIETQFQSLGAAPAAAPGMISNQISNQAVSAAAPASQPANGQPAQANANGTQNQLNQNQNQNQNPNQSNSGQSNGNSTGNQIKDQIKKRLPF